MKALNERYNYGLELFLLSIDEGITGYRDDSLEVRRIENCRKYAIDHPFTDRKAKPATILDAFENLRLRRAIWMDYGCDCLKSRQKEQLHFLWRIPEAGIRSRGLNVERRPYRDWTQRGRYRRDGLDEQYAHLMHLHTTNPHQLSSHERGYRSS